MSDPIRRYLDARKAMMAAHSAVSAYQKLLGETASNLERNRAKFMFSNCEPGLPPDVALGRPITRDAREWPSAEQIQQALAKWHEAVHEQKSAWAALPESDRSGLQQPV